MSDSHEIPDDQFNGQRILKADKLLAMRTTIEWPYLGAATIEAMGGPESPEEVAGHELTGVESLNDAPTDCGANSTKQDLFPKYAGVPMSTFVGKTALPGNA